MRFKESTNLPEGYGEATMRLEIAIVLKLRSALPFVQSITLEADNLEERAKLLKIYSDVIESMKNYPLLDQLMRKAIREESQKK